MRSGWARVFSLLAAAVLQGGVGDAATVLNFTHEDLDYGTFGAYEDGVLRTTVDAPTFSPSEALGRSAADPERFEDVRALWAQEFQPFGVDIGGSAVAGELFSGANYIDLAKATTLQMTLLRGGPDPGFGSTLGYLAFNHSDPDVSANITSSRLSFLRWAKDSGALQIAAPNVRDFPANATSNLLYYTDKGAEEFSLTFPAGLRVVFFVLPDAWVGCSFTCFPKLRESGALQDGHVAFDANNVLFSYDALQDDALASVRKTIDGEDFDGRRSFLMYRDEHVSPPAFVFSAEDIKRDGETPKGDDSFSDIAFYVTLGEDDAVGNTGDIFSSGAFLESALPSAAPSPVPSASPSAVPSPLPSAFPTRSPSTPPTLLPTGAPSAAPSGEPSVHASEAPTASPVASQLPSPSPTVSPSTAPSHLPSEAPSEVPSDLPSETPSRAPSDVPSSSPTAAPSEVPSREPSQMPSRLPSTTGSTNAPSALHSPTPTVFPTEPPTTFPGDVESLSPTAQQSSAPTAPGAEASPVPSALPTQAPSTIAELEPTEAVSAPPSAEASISPSAGPSEAASPAPTGSPSASVPAFLRDARISNSYATLVFSFAQETDRGGYGSSRFPCGAVLAGASLRGENCSFAAPDRMVLEGLSTSAFAVSDAVTLKAGALQLACAEEPCASVRNEEEGALILAPEDGIAPRLSLEFTSAVSKCDAAAEVDARASLFGGGRPMEFFWAVEERSGASDAASDASYAASILEIRGSGALSAAAGGLLEIPTSRFVAGASYNFSVFARNFAGAESERAHVVLDVASTLFPTVRIAGATFPEVDASGVFIVGAAEVRSCETNGAIVRRSWRVVEETANTVREVADLGSELSLVLPPYFFAPGGRYRVEFEALDEFGFSAAAAIYPRLKPADVAAIIRGCNQTVNAGTGAAPHVVDAGLSHDPAVGDAAAEAARSAVSVSFENFTAECAPGSGGGSLDELLGAATVSNRTMTLNATGLAGCIVSGVVVAQSATSRQTRRCELAFSTGRVPVIDLAAGASLQRVNEGGAFAVIADVVTASPLLAGWALPGQPGVELGAAATSATSYAVEEGDLSGAAAAIRVPANLVLRDVLPVGGAYVLSLSASFAGSSEAATASILVERNAPPLPGVFSVEPASGSQDTAFLMQAQHFTDDVGDLPLQYSFSVDAFALNPTVTSASKLRTLLPVASRTARLRVADAFGAATQLQQPVAVLATGEVDPILPSVKEIDAFFREAALSLGALSNATASGLNSFFGQPASIFALVRTAASAFFASEAVVSAHVRSLAGFVEALLESSSAAAQAPSAISAYADILGGARNRTEALNGETSQALLASLSAIVASGAAPNASLRDIVDIAADALEYRAAGAVAGDGPVEVQSRAINGSTRSDVLVSDADVFVLESAGGGGSLAVAASLLAAAGVEKLGGFALSLTLYATELYAGYARNGSEVATDVARLALSQASIANPLETGAGQFALTLRLRPGNEELLSQNASMECGVWDAALLSLTRLAECTATLGLGTVTCSCDLEGVRRRMQAANGTQVDEEYVSIDLSSMVVTSGGVISSNLAADGPVSDAGPLMLSVIAAILGGTAVLAARAQQLDARDQRLKDKRLIAAHDDFRRYLAVEGFGVRTVKKLLDFGIESPTDIVALKRQGTDLDDMVKRIRLDEREARLFRYMVFKHSPMGQSFNGSRREGSSAGKPSAFYRDDSLLWHGVNEERPSSPAEAQLASVGSVESARRNAAQLTAAAAPTSPASTASLPERFDVRSLDSPRTMAGKRGIENGVQPRKLLEENALHDEEDLRDGDLWYGLLVATPAALRRFSERPLLTRIYDAIFDGHDYLNAVFLTSGNAPTRLVRVLDFVGTVVTHMIACAVVYQVLYPEDDAFCGDRSAAGAAVCEEPRSGLNRDENRCFYHEASGTCRPVTVPLTAEVVAIAAVFAVMIALPPEAVFKGFIEYFLSDAPQEGLDYFGYKRLVDKQKLETIQVKQTAVLYDQEMRFLRRHPECIPWKYRTPYVGPWLLERRVRAHCLEAAQLERDMEAEQRELQLKVLGAKISHESFISKVQTRKMRVLKIAIRDALPLLKRRVFGRFSKVRSLREPMGLRERRLALCFLFGYIGALVLYMLNFSRNTNRETSEGWLVSFVFAELFRAVVILPARIVLLGIVLPSFIRHDITFENGLRRMPHFSTAGLFARQRPDLVPGLALLLDENFPESEDHQKRSDTPVSGPRSTDSMRSFDDFVKSRRDLLSKMHVDSSFSVVDLESIFAIADEREGYAFNDEDEEKGIHYLDGSSEGDSEGSRASGGEQKVFASRPNPFFGNGLPPRQRRERSMDIEKDMAQKGMMRLCRRRPSAWRPGGRDRAVHDAPDFSAGCILGVVANAVLVLFSVVLLLPEPVQTVVMDEVFPSVVAIFIVIDFGFQTSETVSFIAQCLILALFVAALVFVSFLIQKKAEHDLNVWRRGQVTELQHASQQRISVQFRIQTGNPVLI